MIANLFFPYAGRRILQHPRIQQVFPEFLSLERFDRIIELGSADGGLTTWLVENVPGLPRPLISYDRQPPAAHPDIDFRYADILSFPAEISELIAAPGRVLLLCDNGDKPREFRGYAPYLKPGDAILAHDLGFAEWPWYEITDADVAETCDQLGLVPFHAPLMRTVAWLSRWRPWADQHGSCAAVPAH